MAWPDNVVGRSLTLASGWVCTVVERVYDTRRRSFYICREDSRPGCETAQLWVWRPDDPVKEGSP